MADSLHSASWYAVTKLRPKLLHHAEIHRRVLRDQVWYLLQDPATGRFHRLSLGAYLLIVAMDGRKTVNTLWQEACEQAGDDMPTQDEVVQLLSQLHAQDLLYCEVSPDIAELFQRYRKQKRGIVKRTIGNPLSLRFPLFDPDEMLTHWVGLFKPLFGWFGVFLWILVVLPAIVLAGLHWPSLTHNISDRILSGQNLIVLWLVFPLVKALHELGHGFATKVWGGAVHEVGLMFMLFTPVPYVDASTSYSFQSKWRRAVVGAAGILVETFLAGLAMYVWALTEEGIVRAIAFNVMVIAGVSTVIINGNPLLKYDGYYVLTDLIEMPNLAARGAKYLTYLTDKYLLGAKQLQAGAETSSERAWFVGYTIFSFIYRIIVTLSIIFFVAGAYFFFGVLMALWSAVTMIVLPIWKAAKHIFQAPSLRKSRTYAVKLSGSLLLLAMFFIFFIPVPFSTQSEGIVWLPEDAIVRAGENGFFSTLLVRPGTLIQKGEPLINSMNKNLTAELEVQHAKVDELQSRYIAEQYHENANLNRTKAEQAYKQLQQEQEALKRIELRVRNLVVAANASGVFNVSQPNDLPGRYFKKGEVIGYVLRGGAQIVRVVVNQDDIDIVRNRTKSVEIRLAQLQSSIVKVNFIRAVPSGESQLPSRALSIDGGGKFAVDPKDSEGLKSLQKTFQFDLQLPEGKEGSVFGGRAYVRFSHGFSPLAYQWLIRLRQLFLTRFNV